MSANLTPPADLDVRALRDLCEQLAREAGALIVDGRPDDLGVASTKSSATDVVTVMDQRSQDLVRERLAAARPRDAFYGEEEGGASGESGLTWVVDPIDGTVNYLYGLPAYSVSVAAVIGDPATDGAWRPVAGAVVNPVSGECYVAALGEGATLQVGDAPRRTLRVAEPESLGQTLVATGFGYEAGRRRWQAAILAEVLGDVRDIRRLGSAALDLCRVADGTVDAFYERGLNAWDLAAGWLVVTEAGGVVDDGTGADPRTAMVLAAAPRTHAALGARLRSAIAVVGEGD